MADLHVHVKCKTLRLWLARGTSPLVQGLKLTQLFLIITHETQNGSYWKLFTDVFEGTVINLSDMLVIIFKFQSVSFAVS